MHLPSARQARRLVEQIRLRDVHPPELRLGLGVDPDRRLHDRLVIVASVPVAPAVLPRPRVKVRRVHIRRVVAKLLGELGLSLQCRLGPRRLTAQPGVLLVLRGSLGSPAWQGPIENLLHDVRTRRGLILRTPHHGSEVHDPRTHVRNDLSRHLQELVDLFG